MLLIFTADADDAPPSTDEGLQEKALLDTEELREVDSFSVAPSDKVELDLDDAPFLEEEEEEEPEEVFEQERSESLPMGPEKVPFYKQRTFILIAAGVGLLLLLLILTIVFWPDTRRVEAPPEEIEGQLEEIEAEVPEPYVWDPFVVELKDRDGTIRFLYIKLAAPYEKEVLLGEFLRKSVQIRDAVYYYLKNKDIAYLDDKTNEETLKKNLLAVINQYLSNEQLKELYILEYLVK